MSWILDALIWALSWICLLGGGLFVLTGGIGLLRLPDFFSRLHGAGVTDTLGAGLLVLGLALQAGAAVVVIKLALILLFIFFTGPVATHALAKAALHGGLEPTTTHAPESPSSKR